MWTTLAKQRITAWDPRLLFSGLVMSLVCWPFGIVFLTTPHTRQLFVSTIFGYLGAALWLVIATLALLAGPAYILAGGWFLRVQGDEVSIFMLSRAGFRRYDLRDVHTVTLLDRPPWFGRWKRLLFIRFSDGYWCQLPWGARNVERLHNLLLTEARPNNRLEPTA